MSIILELRRHLSHSGTPLVHPTSEDVVLANVFGVVKNLSPKSVLLPWLRSVTGLGAQGDCSIAFWEKQPRPIGVQEGNTVVDLVVESSDTLVFVEVKMDAPASSGTTHDPNRNQLVRNLDVGFARADTHSKQFALIFVTPDLSAPSLVEEIRSGAGPFPANPSTPPAKIQPCLRWAPWASIGDSVADAYSGGQLNDVELKIARDLLAYLALKGLWENTLEDEEIFYQDRLYRALRRDGSPFVAYSHQHPERYDAWRGKAWDESSLRNLLGTLRIADKALLKLLADAGGAMRQDVLMERLPILRGKSSKTLRALKAHVNGACKQLDRAALLSDGSGSGPSRIHQINPQLGPLRAVVIEVAQTFEVDWRLLEPATMTETAARAEIRPASVSVPPIIPARRQASSEDKAWYVTMRSGNFEIGAFVNAKGSCSYRTFSMSGRFISIRRARGEFASVFQNVIANARRFFPGHQPALVDAEKAGLPRELVDAADAVVKSWPPSVAG